MFKTGDIFIERTGGSYCCGVEYINFNLFEYDEAENNGAGVRYSSNGDRYIYHWAYPKKDCLFKRIPKDILYSFHHGFNSFNIEKSKFEESKNIEDIIRNSDYVPVLKKDVEIAKIASSVKTFEDVCRNWEKLQSGMYLNVMTICLNHIGIKEPHVRNGEIGIAAIETIHLFLDYYLAINNEVRKYNAKH